MMIFRWNSVQVILRNPDLRDKQTLNLNVHKKRMMNGDWVTYVSTPVSIVWDWTFSHICRDLMLEAMAFAKITAGQQITVIDHLDRRWIGKLITPDFEFATPAIANNTFSWKFQGFEYPV